MSTISGKKKLLTISVAIIVVLALMGATAFFTWNHFNKEVKERPIAETIKCCTVDSGEIVSNLTDPGSFIKIQFTFETDTKEGKKELEERMFQVKNIILKTFAETKSEFFKDPKNISKIENSITEQTNSIMHEGKVLKTVVVSKVVQ